MSNNYPDTLLQKIELYKREGLWCHKHNMPDSPGVPCALCDNPDLQGQLEEISDLARGLRTTTQRLANRGK